MVFDPWLWWVEMNVTVVVDATRDHGFESPVLHEWLHPLHLGLTWILSVVGSIADYAL